MGNVEPYNCWDGVMNGATKDEELENILSILDFPMESLEADGLAGDWDASKSHYLGPIPSDDVLMGPPMIAQGKSDTRLLPVPVDVSKPSKMDAAPQPKQPPYQFKDSSVFHIPPHNKSAEVKVRGAFQSQSPVSVLESSGSVSAGKSLLTRSHVCKRTRSRRARPSGVNPWFLRSPLFATYCPSRKTSKCRRNKESRRKLSQLPAAGEIMEYSSNRVDLQSAASQHPAVVKKCTHCEVTKTPQWREGPMGPKTLCNACGVRYRSGRLFPEYRPAASPTFLPSLHSNSHKKVIEMRSKAKQQVMKIDGLHAHE